MPAATVRCHLDSLAGRICALARGLGLPWTRRWEAVLGLLLGDRVDWTGDGSG